MASSALVFGRETANPGVTLTTRNPLHLVQVSAFRGGEPALAAAITEKLGIPLDARPNRASYGRQAMALWLGPQRWMIEAETFPSLSLSAEQAAIVDLGHARRISRLSGPNARDVLAKGCLLDLHRVAFGAGACAQTSLFHSMALIHAVADATFDIYVPRSFGHSVWESLMDAAGEFGCRVE